MNTLNQAISLHQQGRLAQARPLYEQWRRANPGDINALQLLSVCLAQLGELPQALQMLDHAISLAPDQPAFHNNRANMLRLLGRLPEALESCSRAIALKPDYAEAYNNRGNVEQDLKLTELALADYTQAIGLNPAYVEALYNSAVARQSLHQHDEAIAALNKVLTLQPGLPQALARLAVSHGHHRQFDLAQKALGQALQAQPDHPEFLLIGATLSAECSRPEESIKHCERLLARQPDHSTALAKLAYAHLMLRNRVKAQWFADQALKAGAHDTEALLVQGHLLSNDNHFEPALGHYVRATQIDPTHAAAHLFAGQTLVTLKRPDEARDMLQKALALGPDQSNLLGSLAEVKLMTADWSELNGLREAIEKAVRSAHIENQNLTLCKLLDDAMLLKHEAQKAGQARVLHEAAKPKFARRDPRRSKIRVGYFSADFGEHPVSLLMLESLERHSRENFELVAFAIGPARDDDMNRRIRLCFDRYLEVHDVADAEVADMARQIGIDIAVDLTGYTLNCRTGIFANRAAPIQVNYLGYPGTLGAPFMDYLIADPIVIPAELRGAYTEHIAYLPDQFMPNDTRRPISPNVPTRASQQLPQDAFVFCGFNNLSKLLPEVFDSWMRIMVATPGSVLWLQAGGALQEQLRQHAQARGVDGSRLVFASRVATQADYLALYSLADLFLDTAPYNAHATAMDALWAGLPLLTCMGQTFASRVAASLVTAAGLPELASTDRSRFEALAIEIATTPGRAQALKAQLAANRTAAALYDNARFTRNLEGLYQQMYQRHLKNLPPELLSLP
jgi:predicted O-linked N-acetylglucosamine transferase (SPINDLY family)